MSDTSTYLILGGYTFEGFGVPERIPGGGKQHLVVHKLLGGDRIIDALGADDDVIAFQGRFRGPGAMDDAMFMDAMRRSGRPVTLTYWNQTVTVVVSGFSWSFERFFEVPYKLECTVAGNQAQQQTSTPETLDGAVGSDTSLAGTLSAGSDKAAAQVSSISQTYSAIGPLATASDADVATMQDAVSTSTGGLQSIAGAADLPQGPIPGLGGSNAGGGDPGASAADLSAIAQVMNDGSAAQNTLPVVQRMGVNLGNLGSGAP